MRLNAFIVFFILLIAIENTLTQKCDKIAVNERIDCAPDRPNESEVCHQRKCCFSDEEFNSTNGKNITKCFIPNDYMGYEVKEIRRDFSHIFVSLERRTASGFPKDIPTLAIEITFLNDKSLRIRIVDSNNRRYEPPIPQLTLPDFPIAFDPLYVVDVTQEGLLTIKRKSNERVVLGIELSKMVYSDQFIQLKTSIPSHRVYGLGEHKASFLRSTDWQIYTTFNHDIPPGLALIDTNLYGSHPFYLNVEDSHGLSNGVFLYNSNAMDVLLTPEPAVTWRPIGGIVDMFVFMGPKPDQVVREYISLIGRPTLPPFWSLGYHQCRCGPSPHTLKEQIDIWNRTIGAGIPFDVQWNAKEYMTDFNDFTVDETTFGGFGAFVDQLHELGQHYVPIVDPGIDPMQPNGTYAPFDEGMELDIFIKNASDQVLVGRVWNKSGKTVWPDFSHPSATLYWKNQFESFHKKVAFDGSWNDMNEISDFVRGSLDGCPDSPLESPPYLPGRMDSMTDMTICMTAKHYAGVHYNIHNLYAFYQSIATNLALREIRKRRPFVISRATYPGQGKYSGHWDGDTSSSYDHMAWTIPSIMNFNLFGIPLVGGDICGFNGRDIHFQVKNDTQFQELCARWFQIGAFYPFSRNHNNKPIDQDPVALGETVVRAAKNALQIRYSLLPYLYTLFYGAEANADTVVRPLFFEFPEDNNTYGVISESQFMWGQAFMIIPVISANQSKVNAYFPPGRWYPYSLALDENAIESNGDFMELEAPLDRVNTAIRGGHIVPVLPPKQTTTEMRKEKFGLIVALDGDQRASGRLYWDDGESLDPLQSESYSLIAFNALNGTLSTEVIHHRYEGQVVVDTILVMGVSTGPTSVSLNGKTVAHEYDPKTHKFSVKGLNVNLIESMNEMIWK